MNTDTTPAPADLSGHTNSPISAAVLTLFCLFVPVLCFLFWIARKLPPVASEHGAGIDLMLNYLLLSVGGLMLIGHVVLAWFIWRFSRESRVTHRKADSKTEWKWSLVPLVLMTFVAEGGVLAIGVPVWKKFYAAPPPADSIVVEITAEQFAWTSRYPGPDAKFGRTNVKLIDDENTLGLDSKDATSKDDLIVGGELRLPVNKPAHLRLRSKDVLHSLFLPSQRVKQDVVPGMVIDAWFVPTQTGEFEILCTELCGLGHYKMRGVLRVTTQEEYEKWLAERASM